MWLKVILRLWIIDIENKLSKRLVCVLCIKVLLLTKTKNMYFC